MAQLVCSWAVPLLESQPSSSSPTTTSFGIVNPINHHHHHHHHQHHHCYSSPSSHRRLLPHIRCTSQQQLSVSDPGSDSGATASSKQKQYVWVNPNSPRASQLRNNSYHSRYSFLVNIARALDSCQPTQPHVDNLLHRFGDTTTTTTTATTNTPAVIEEQDAVIILNNMTNPDTALLALRYFHHNLPSSRRQVVLYNVTLKVLRKSKDLDIVEKLFDEMLQRGVNPDNATFSTIISCCRMCNLPNKAVEWYEKMPDFGCVPDGITYSAMIDAYGRAGNVDKALNLYDRARSERWWIDVVTFSTLIKIYAKSGNYDGCLNVYQEMKALGVKPNLVIYNSLLDGMGRARRPWQAKLIYKDMTHNGISPSWGTYAALLRAFCRARYGEDAIKIYTEMKEKGLNFNITLYNTLLATCADVGYLDEAVQIYEDMKSSGSYVPDSWTYSSMITVYSCSGQVTKAESVVNEMVEAGFEPNIFVLTSLIQCYGKACRTDDVVRSFNRVLELGITPDDRFCGCLLNVMTQTSEEELSKLADCVEKANPKLGGIVKILLEGESSESTQLRREASELFEVISVDVKKAYCNCLIDLCVNLNLLDRACELLDLGINSRIYTDIQLRTPTQWSLQLKSLSLGAALTSLHVWMNDLANTIETGGQLPPLLGINTGHGKHKYSEKGLAGVFEAHLKELKAPFHESPDKPGWFLTTKIAAESWLRSQKSAETMGNCIHVLSQKGGISCGSQKQKQEFGDNQKYDSKVHPVPVPIPTSLEGKGEGPITTAMDTASGAPLIQIMCSDVEDSPPKMSIDDLNKRRTVKVVVTRKQLERLLKNMKELEAAGSGTGNGSGTTVQFAESFWEDKRPINNPFRWKPSLTTIPE